MSTSRDNIIILLSAIKLHFLQYLRLTQRINFSTLAIKAGLTEDEVKESLERLLLVGLAEVDGRALISVEAKAFTMYEITLKSSKIDLSAQRKKIYKSGDKPRLPRVKVENDPGLIKDSGNHCGHSPHVLPIFTLPEGEKKRPPVIALLYTKISDYFTKTWLLPDLNKANGSERQQRSERRESCILLTGAILSRLDLCSMRVGKPIGGDFSGIKLKSLAKIAGISLSRAVRASKDLVLAGLIKVVQKSEQKEDGTFIGYAAVRLVSEKLFKSFGLLTILKESQEKLYRRNLAKKHDETKEGALITVAELMQAAADKVTDLAALTGSSNRTAAFSVIGDILK